MNSSIFAIWAIMSDWFRSSFLSELDAIGRVGFSTLWSLGGGTVGVEFCCSPLPTEEEVGLPLRVEL